MSALRDFFAELGDYLGEKYFSPDLGDLNYLNSDAAVRFLPLCIVGLCAGIFLAALIYYYNCEYLGRAVRRLYAAGAFSPEEAKTLAEIRCDSRAYRKNLRRDTVLSKYVRPAGEDGIRAVLHSRRPPRDRAEALQAAARRHCLADRHSDCLRGALFHPVVLYPRCGAACRQRDRAD